MDGKNRVIKSDRLRKPRIKFNYIGWINIGCKCGHVFLGQGPQRLEVDKIEVIVPESLLDIF